MLLSFCCSFLVIQICHFGFALSFYCHFAVISWSILCHFVVICLSFMCHFACHFVYHLFCSLSCPLFRRGWRGSWQKKWRLVWQMQNTSFKYDFQCENDKNMTRRLQINDERRTHTHKYSKMTTQMTTTWQKHDNKMTKCDTTKQEWQKHVKNMSKPNDKKNTFHNTHR